MFERYTQAARLTIFKARYMATEFGSLKIETEHLLLGVLATDKTLASRLLASPWAAETVWKLVERRKTIRKKIAGTSEIPLNEASKRVLALAAEEADLLSDGRVGTEHLLLGLLRQEKSFANEILSELGIRLASTRTDLSRMPHDDSKQQEFVRERDPVPNEVVALRARVSSIRVRVGDAVFNNDFDKVRVLSDEEAAERKKLILLYRQHGLLDWLYD